MRIIPFCGKYIILFQDIIETDVSANILVGFLLVMAFASGFTMLLPDIDGFENLGDSLIKTATMFSGEFVYKEIFSPDYQWYAAPFPTTTNVLYFAFFMTGIIAWNSLVGLIVDLLKLC